MKGSEALDELFDAERQARPPSGAPDAGWERLSHAMAQGAAPLDVSSSLSKTLLSTAAKWGAIGVAASALGGLGVRAISSDGTADVRARSVTTPAVRAPSAELSRSEVLPQPAQAPAERAQVRATEPLTAHRSGAAEPAPAAVASATGAGSTFEEELRLIKLAKAALDDGRGHIAEVWLAEHAQRFPRGVFADERKALRILVLCERGELERGAKLAQEFAEQQVASPLVERLQRACRADTAPRQVVK